MDHPAMPYPPTQPYNTDNSPWPATNTVKSPFPESPTERLRRIVRESQLDTARYERALDILSRHPEFEEFLELQRLMSPSF